MRILVLSRNVTLYSTSRLILSARARGHEVTVADPLDCRIVVASGRPSIFLGGKPVAHADMVIPRIGASITNYGLAVVRQFDMMGIPVLNTAVAIARSRDKLRALQLLTKKDIEVPTTVCARSPESIEHALALVGGVPAIVKLQQGAQGIGTMIAETPQAVTSLLETLWAMGQDIVLQEYIAESKGRDYRALVVGGRVIASMRRQAKKGEFRSNLHRGGQGVGVTLDRKYTQAAVAAAKVMGLDVAGVDMLEGKSGPKILEINSSPGLEGIERATGIDVAGAIIAYAEKCASNKGGRPKRDAIMEDERRPRRIRASAPPPRPRPPQSVQAFAREQSSPRMLRVERHEAVAVLTLARPRAKNALSREMLEDLRAAVLEVEADKTCRAAVLTGEGEMFAAGGDLRELRGKTTMSDAQWLADAGGSVCRAIMASRIPFVAALSGPAIGGGAELALACDLRVLGPSGSLCFKHARMGVTTAWGVLPKLVAIVGPATAARLLLTAEVCAADEALRLGLADKLATDGEVVVRALEWATSTTLGAPGAIAALKEIVASSVYGGGAAARALERESFVTSWMSADHAEAVEAFFEKRDPVFRGE